MKITNFGGATAIIEHKGKRILFDPWLDDGIFHGSWYHYPPLNVSIKDVGHVDYIYISHIHEDHCSAGTIKELNKDAEVILMDRTPNLVANFLKANQFNFKKIHLIKPHSPAEIAPNLVVDMVTADPANTMNYTIDSGLIMKWDDYVIYNANDCPPYEAGLEYIKNRYGRVDLALLTYTGGSGYPACYKNLSDSEKIAEVERIKNSSFKLFADSVQKLAPTYAMPFADQYVVAGSRSHLNKFVAHPTSPGAVYPIAEENNFLDKLLLLNSGQMFDLGTKAKSPDEPFLFLSEKDRDQYVEEKLKSKTYDYERVKISPSVSLTRLFKYARERLWEQQERDKYFPDHTYYFSVPDRNQLFEIKLKENKVSLVSIDAKKTTPYLMISAESTLMTFLLLGQISWNIADAALFLDYERVPNKYDPQIHAFVNFLKA